MQVQALVCTTPGTFSYEWEEAPEWKEGYTLLNIRRVGVCGTDLHAFEGTQPYFSYPRILGHELSGTVERTGLQSGFSEGERVTVLPYFNCGQCIACRGGKPNCCVGLEVCGVHVHGGMRSRFLVPDSALINGEGLSFDELALVEPLAIGAHAVQRAVVQQGESVLVVGAGPIGLGILSFAKIAGADVIALDLNEDRLSFCRNRLNIRKTINGKKEDVDALVRRYTNGDYPSVVIDATGNRRAMEEAFRYMAHGGRYVLVGLQKEPLSFSHPEFHKREGTLMSSRNATREDFERVIRSIKDRSVDPSLFITQRVPFKEAGARFPQLLRPESGVIKALIELDG